MSFSNVMKISRCYKQCYKITVNMEQGFVANSTIVKIIIKISCYSRVGYFYFIGGFCATTDQDEDLCAGTKKIKNSMFGENRIKLKI